MRKALGLLVMVLAGCGTAAMADGGYPGTTTTEKPDHHVTTTTEKPGHHHTTTTKPDHVTTTTHKPPHETTTTVKNTTTTAGPTTTTAGPTTTVKQTTTTVAGTTTTTPGGGGTTTIPGGGTTTTFPTPTPFGINVFATCPDNLPAIQINFPTNAALAGQSGILDFSDGTSYGVLVYRSGGSITIPWPTSLQSPLTLTYRIQGQTATATVTLPPNCLPSTTTTSLPTTSLPTTSTTPTATTTTPSTSTTVVSPPSGSTTTSTSPPSSSTTVVATTTLPPSTTTLPLALSGAATVCRAEVPTIVINFGNTFPELAGRTGTLTMADINGNVVSTQPLVYRPNTTVELLYPGTRVNPDGSIADVPGWNLNAAGLWVRDPSDAFLREGIRLTYTVNPTATAFITYPPESANCANPDNPTAPPRRPPVAPPAAPPKLPPTGNDPWYAAAAVFALVGGVLLRVAARRD